MTIFLFRCYLPFRYLPDFVKIMTKNSVRKIFCHNTTEEVRMERVVNSILPLLD